METDQILKVSVLLLLNGLSLLLNTNFLKNFSYARDAFILLEGSFSESSREYMSIILILKLEE